MFLLIAASVATSGCTGELQEPDAEGVILRAIEAHGGAGPLRAASTFKAEVRRFQQGSSYVLTNYYRPGMVRLEQDLDDGTLSGDVIGDPHCWGRAGVVVIRCSDETRENDRPRVIMEMAAQLWPLTGPDWELRSATRTALSDRDTDVVEALYRPRETVATFEFDRATHRLERISVAGVKRGVLGVHVHEYSDYRQACDVLMPHRNIKSFEGEVWVEEEILDLECMPIDEALFEEPAQVVDGAIVDLRIESATTICKDIEPSARDHADVHAKLENMLEHQGIDAIGNPVHYRYEDASEKLCVPIPEGRAAGVSAAVLETFAEGNGKAIYAVDPELPLTEQYLDALLENLRAGGDEPRWPIRSIVYDNDGMGPTGDVIVELAVVAANTSPASTDP